MPSKYLIRRHIALSCVFAAVFLALDRPYIVLISPVGFAAWYPGAGLMWALMLGVSPWYAPLAAFAGMLADATIYRAPLLSYSQLASTLGFTAVYAVAACIVREPLRVGLRLARRRDVLIYLLVTLTVAAIATTIRVFSLTIDHLLRPDQFWSAAAGWFFGNAIPQLGVAPFLLIHVLPRVRNWLTIEKPLDQHQKSPPGWPLLGSVGIVIETVCQALTLGLAIWIIFQPWSGHSLYLGLIPIIWIAMHHGVRRAVVGIFALNVGMVSALRLHPASLETSNGIGLFMLIASAVGLMAGSAITERHDLGLELQQQTAYLNSLMENSPLGIAVLDSAGNVEFANSAFEELSLYRQRDIAGRFLNSLFAPDDETANPIQDLAPVFNGEKLHRNVRWQRKDGKILDLDLHAVPFMEHGRVRGAYTICQDISERIKAFKAEKQNAQALKRLVKELEVRTQQMSWLSEMGDLLQCCESEKEAGAVIVRSIRMVFPEAVCGILYTFRSSRNLLGTVASWGATDRCQEHFLPAACWGLRRGHPHWSESDIRCGHLPEDLKSRYLCIPMVGRGEALGLLVFGFTTEAIPQLDAEALRRSQQRLGTTVAGQIALSLASLRLRETLRDQSIRDPLTGLFNRRFMEESLDKEMQRAARKGRNLSILCLDIDHFKRFNDTFGHDAGDEVLRSIADVFRNSFRGEDVICRQGGEEFAIILPEASAQDAALRAERLCTEVRGRTCKYKNEILGPVTISVGVSAFPQHASTAEGLLKAADQCLFKSKQSGRDRVTVAAPQARSAAGDS